MNSNVLEQELQKIKDKLQYPCIAILGKTGAGKSTLIKEIFDIDTIKIGAGKPITKSYENKYPNPPREDKPIFLYDSPGYEASQTKEFLAETIKFLKKHSFQENPSGNDNIHLVWYAIGGKRFEDFDETVIRNVYELGIPLIIVLTQVDLLKPEELIDLKNDIEQYVKTVSNTIEILEVAASPIYGHKNKRDKDKLLQIVDKSIGLLPVVYKEAFIYSQRINIKSKRKLAWTFIGVAATSVFSTSFIPFPGTTPAVTIASQGGLLKHLADIYNVKEYSEALLMQSDALDEGKYVIIASFLIDIASTAVGAVFPLAFAPVQSLAGVAAASYIITLGFTYVTTLEQIAEKFLNSDIAQEEIETYIKEKFRENFSKYSFIKVSNQEDINRIGNEFIIGNGIE